MTTRYLLEFREPTAREIRDRILARLEEFPSESWPRLDYGLTLSTPPRERCASGFPDSGECLLSVEAMTDPKLVRLVYENLREHGHPWEESRPVRPPSVYGSAS